MALPEPQRLAMAALGVTAHVPQHASQPTLADGVHLRWASSGDAAFPWHG